MRLESRKAVARERVADGARFFDEAHPGWWREGVIPLDELNIADSNTCIVGWVRRGQDLTSAFKGLYQWAIEHGNGIAIEVSASDGHMNSDADRFAQLLALNGDNEVMIFYELFPLYTKFWTEEIIARREGMYAL